MKVLMVRAKIKEENVADSDAAVSKVIAALEEAQPAGVRYATGKLSDGVTVVALLKLDDDGGHPLRGFPHTRRWWRTSSSGTPSRRLSSR
jgi:hypothetical protein